MSRYGFLLAFTLPLMVVAGFLLGGAWNFLTIGFSYLLLPFLDIASGEALFQPSAAETADLERDPWYRGLLYVGALMNFGLIVFGAWAVSHTAFSGWALFGFVLSVGTVSGSLGIVIAHELGHHLQQADKLLARFTLASVCYMHFHIEHNRGHHSKVATPEDPASARYGEDLYRFLPRTLVGSFTHAWHLEEIRLAKLGVGTWSWKNPMLWCVAAPLLMAGGFYLVFGLAALGYFFAQALIAVVLLETVNYIEHYGLERRALPDGSHERMTAAHSWNSNHRLSSYFLFNLTRHSHHHIQVQRHYQALAHEDESPQLPVGYAGMLMLAFFPPLWRRVVHPRIAAHRAGTR
jgi:alkane 1-monooxygenase